MLDSGHCLSIKDLAGTERSAAGANDQLSGVGQEGWRARRAGRGQRRRPQSGRLAHPLSPRDPGRRELGLLVSKFRALEKTFVEAVWASGSLC